MRFSKVGSLHLCRAAQVPFAPPADGAEVDVVDIGVAVIFLAQPLDEVEMGLQDGGIVHIGDGERALTLVVGLKFLAAPFRMIGMAFGRSSST